jgi:signal peptidase I
MSNPPATADPSPPEPAEAHTEPDEVTTDVPEPSRARGAIEWAVVIVGAVVLALVIKTFVMQAFFIPSPSMDPTLIKDDRVLVNKLSYKLHDVNRGDIVVFERPPSEGDGIKDLIKRVIALPGESLVINEGKVYIDGRELSEPYLPDGVVTHNKPESSRCAPANPCIVPDGQVWVMGDNRDNSRDSRFFGTIPESTIVGRAFVTVWPLNRLGGL